MRTNSVRIHALKLSTNFSKDSCLIFTYLHQTITHTLSSLHKDFKDLFYIDLLTHTLTYTHIYLPTWYYILTASAAPQGGWMSWIWQARHAALNPFQKICYKVLFRNVAPSRKAFKLFVWYLFSKKTSANNVFKKSFKQSKTNTPSWLKHVSPQKHTLHCAYMANKSRKDRK